jgi:hypothetical protein
MTENLSQDDETRIELMAKAMGLDLALAGFREDLRIAFIAAETQRRALAADLPVTAEPWPPMRVEGPR